MKKMEKRNQHAGYFDDVQTEYDIIEVNFRTIPTIIVD